MTTRPTGPARKAFSARTMASTAMLIAVTVVMILTPVGRIQLPIVSVTIAHTPILIAVLIVGLSSGLVVALAFGVTGLIIALVAPATLLDPFFVNPLISILPRLLIPITTYASYRGLSKLFGRQGPGNVAITAVSIVIGNLTTPLGCI